MKSHQAEGIPARTIASRPHRIAIDSRDGVRRSRRLAIIATLAGSAISGALLSVMILWL